MSFTHTARSLASMPTIFIGGRPIERAGVERMAWNGAFANVPDEMDVEADGFGVGATMPAKFTSEGDNLSPGLRWINVPKGTRSFTILCEDPDAPTPDPFVHWLAYNISSDCRALPEYIAQEAIVYFPVTMLQGKNSTLKTGYTGPQPPRCDDAHRYFFQVYALDKCLALDGGEGRGAVISAMRGHVLAKGATVGTFKR